MSNIFSWHTWRGLNLLETLLVLLLAGFAFMLVVNLAMIMVDGNPSSGEGQLNTMALQEKIEDLRSGYLDGLLTGRDKYHGINRVWSVTEIGPHLRRIEVELIGSEAGDAADKRDRTVLVTYVRTDEV